MAEVVAEREPDVVVLLRSANTIVVAPSTPRIVSVLVPQLTYQHKQFFRGKDAAKRRRLGLPLVEETAYECYLRDHHGRVTTSVGFVDRITRILKKHSYQVVLRWSTDTEAQQEEARALRVYRPYWERLFSDGEELRERQDEALQLMAAHDCGRIDCPPGWGKGSVLRKACQLFAKAKIAVVTKSVSVLHTRLWPELCQYLPDVGMIGGGSHSSLNHRILCCTADSLHHLRDWDPDFVLVDEGHQAAANEFATRLAAFERARLWGFSASWDMRWDNKNLRFEAIFGPVRLKVAYHEAEAASMVVPIEVHFSDVIMDIDPGANLHDTDRERACVWANTYRNELIVRDARQHPEEVVLVTCSTVEHVLRLKKMMPEAVMVYADTGIPFEQLRRFRRLGLIGPDFIDMDRSRKRRLFRLLEKGKPGIYVATPVMNVGVDLKYLSVVVRAEASGSRELDTQIPGRLSRPNERGKAYGLVYDYLDQFARGYAQKAKGRLRSYEMNKWHVCLPARASKSRLQRDMEW